MKKILLRTTVAFIIFHSSFLIGNAQWVTIPDANFRTWLNANGYSACMSGTLMDTTCVIVVNATEVNCSNKNISNLTGIQYFDNLDNLFCDRNQLTTLPALPNSLFWMDCGDNQISSLPALPNSLAILSVTNNLLTSLPVLPNNLNIFSCQRNQLTSLPPIPGTLQRLFCDSNQLTSLPHLPDSMNTCYINDNPIRCFPKVRYIKYFKFGNTAINCLPNLIVIGTSSTPPIGSVPICQEFNSNGCDVLWNISGKTYVDDSANCVFDLSDTTVDNVKVQLWSGGSLVQQTYTIRGTYTFDVSDFGNYETSVDTLSLPFNVLCPANNLHYDTITAIDSLDYDKDFALVCKPDLATWSIRGRFRPGDTRQVDTRAGSNSGFFGINCASGISGTVVITVDPPAQYVSPAAGALTPNSINGNVLTYNISDFGTTDFEKSFNIMVRTHPAAPIGSTVCFSAVVTSDNVDVDTFNNMLTMCFIIVGSFDPNDKQVSPVSDVDVNGERWLTYTVNFQNTGTDTAYHIYITDTLDADLDAISFQLLAYSHQPMVQIKENALRFNFPNINLPDSNTNEPLSHGYVQYKIKLKNNLPIGTQINNTAFIYFDFNEPVVTNTTSNTITNITAVSPSLFTGRVGVGIFPNPASDVVIISVDESMIGSIATITDITGRKMAAVQLQTLNSKLETQNLTNGVYFVTVNDKEGRSATKKLVISK